MPAPFFTTNQAEFGRVEGVYIFEKDPPAFIQGVFLGAVGIAGRTLRGPVDTPVEITSGSRFEEVYGQRSLFGQSTSDNKVREFMMSKPFGKRVVVRVAAAGAAVAEADGDQDLALAPSVLVAFNDDDGSGNSEITGIDLSAFSAGQSITVAGSGANDGTWVANADGTAGGIQLTGIVLADEAAGASVTLTGSNAVINIAASSPGAWGNDLSYDLEDATDGVAAHFNLKVSYRGDTVTYEDCDVSTGNDNLLLKIGADLANLVVVTKLGNGRPDNAAAQSLDGTLGSDGTIADSDYTATDRGLNQLKGYRGVGLVAVADRSTAAIKSAMKVAAEASSDRLFLIWNGNHAETLANILVDAALYRSDRIVYCENSTTTFDFDVAAEVEVPPHAWMASILTQTDVDINPGEEATKQFTAGITGLRYENRSREDYVSLKEAGVASLERDEDGGFLFVSGVVNDLTKGKTQITRRRSADFLQLSVSARLKHFVKKKNTAANRVQMGAEVVAFLNELKDEGRIVEDFSVEQASVNTEAQRAQGRERILMRVKLIGHILALILETEIGQTVILRDAA